MHFGISLISRDHKRAHHSQRWLGLLRDNIRAKFHSDSPWQVTICCQEYACFYWTALAGRNTVIVKSWHSSSWKCFCFDRLVLLFDISLAIMKAFTYFIHPSSVNSHSSDQARSRNTTRTFGHPLHTHSYLGTIYSLQSMQCTHNWTVGGQSVAVNRTQKLLAVRYQS